MIDQAKLSEILEDKEKKQPKKPKPNMQKRKVCNNMQWKWMWYFRKTEILRCTLKKKKSHSYY